MLTGHIELDWQNALAIWRKRGRVEDLPRDQRRPRYTPDSGKRLGLDFAVQYRDCFPFVISRLSTDDPFEYLCAFEVLETICWEFYSGAVPDQLLGLDHLLPEVIQEELGGDTEVDDFRGTTMGEYFTAVFT